MEQHGNNTTYNVETVLRKNIVDSEYWRNTCAKLQTWEEIVDQIFYDVTHVEPWMSGNARGASSAFGLLYRLCQIQPSEEQVEALLTHEDSPYIRAVGFLYLRYVGDPKQLWRWLRPYVRDPEELWPSGDGGSAVTIGEYVRDVFLEQYYFETIFPRIPKPVNDEWMGSLRSMGLPAKAMGNGGQGGPDRRGLDEPNRRPASVKASLSVAFGQRAPNRATAREEGRGLGAGMKNVYNGTREERPRSSSRDTRVAPGKAAVQAAPQAAREDLQSGKRDREGQRMHSRDSAYNRDARSPRQYPSHQHSQRHGDRDKHHRSRHGSHRSRDREERGTSRDTAYRDSRHSERPHSSRHESSRHRSRSPVASSRHREVPADAPSKHRLASAHDL
ncbi:hypothetical protein ABBQ38_000781 [Trebouxia sp. C0009 RCD-2024]